MATPAELFARGWEQQQAGDRRRAEESYRQALRLDPSDGRTWFVLAKLCEAERRPDEAVACFRQAITCCPRDPEGPFALGSLLLHQANYPDAADAFRHCLQLRPDHVEALVNLGFVLGEQEKWDEARASYERALAVRPGLPEALHNLANVHREMGRLDEALACYDQALRRRPGYAKAHVNRGVALVKQGKVDEAVASIRRGLELDPDFAEAHSSLGAALSLQEKLDESVAAYRRALSLNPDMAEAHWNLGLALLLQGNFAEGWPEFEWLWRCKKGGGVPAHDRPLWDGSPLDGKTILLYASQGLGDTIHFVRYCRLVRQRGGRTLVQVQRPLLRLLASCPGIDQLVPQRAELPPFDVHAALQSLPGIFGTDLATIPADVPYLFADPDLVLHWRRQLAPVRGFRVGIVWQGNPEHPWDRHRSVPLAAFEPLARVEGVRLISLQKGPGSEQLAALGGRFPVLSLGPLVDETSGPFLDSAAILANLDLLVTSDTSSAHLAGALGVPVWVALSFSPDWRWLLGRPDSPWYPTMRLVRQTALGDWAGVFDRIAAALREAAARAPRGPLLVEMSPGELLDWLARLEVESERAPDAGRRHQAQARRTALAAVRAETLPESAELTDLAVQLRAVHEALWQRDHGTAGEERRAALRRAIDGLLGERTLISLETYPSS
jgi:tetratricopeptide (TPR) repeat protein